MSNLKVVKTEVSRDYFNNRPWQAFVKFLLGDKSLLAVSEGNSHDDALKNACKKALASLDLNPQDFEAVFAQVA